MPLKPALASSGSESKKLTDFPKWIEAKYDGLRIMLHKEGNMFGVYTRGRNDWSDTHPGFKLLASILPVQKCILDGELFGTTFTAEGTRRQCTVYELYQTLTCTSSLPVTLKYAAFDILYLEGRSLINESWDRRYKYLQQIVNTMIALPLYSTIQIELAQGTFAKDSKKWEKQLEIKTIERRKNEQQKRDFCKNLREGNNRIFN